MCTLPHNDKQYSYFKVTFNTSLVSSICKTQTLIAPQIKKVRPLARGARDKLMLNKKRKRIVAEQIKDAADSNELNIYCKVGGLRASGSPQSFSTLFFLSIKQIFVEM